MYKEISPQEYERLSREEKEFVLEHYFREGYKINKGEMVPVEIKGLAKNLGLRNTVVAG
ncbi:hypothetical protein GOV13_00850 [Candidatus Pacearchaeota archaeon]|nr:hypothetical protein [Candidatus Pacearchaeota archaeon]